MRWGFDLETKSFQVCGLFDVVWMFRTKPVHVCEGTVRYPVGWVQDCDLVVDLVVCYDLYE